MRICTYIDEWKTGFCLVFYFYTAKSRNITVGANIIVPEGYKAIFVCKDKVCDEVNNGKFDIEVTYKNLINTTNLNVLNKVSSSLINLSTINLPL